MAFVRILGGRLRGVAMAIQLKRLGIADRIRLNTTDERSTNRHMVSR